MKLFSLKRVLVAMVAMASMMNVWALSGNGSSESPYVIEPGVAMPCPSAQNTVFYQFTADKNGMLVVDNSQVASNYPSIYYGPSTASCYYSFGEKQPLTQGETIYVSCYCYDDISSKTISFSFRDAVQGENYTDPIMITAGTMTWNTCTSSVWYKAVVPAKNELMIDAAPSGYGYAGVSAIQSNTYLYPTYNGGLYKWNYINTGDVAVDFYIRVDYNYETVSANVSIKAADLADFSHVTGSGVSSDPYNVILDKPYPAGSSYSQVYYKYVAETSGWMGVDMSKLSSDAVIYASTSLSDLVNSYYNYQCNGLDVTAGNTYYIMLYFYSDESAKSVSFSVGEAPAGISVDNPKTLEIGANTWATQNEWWMITVPAGKELSIVPSAYVSYNAYAGKANAQALSGSLSTTYNYSSYAPDLFYTNTTTEDVDVYVNVSYISSTVTATVDLKNASAPANNVTQFGALAWSVVNNEIAAGESVTVTFPNHVGGEDDAAVMLENVYIFDGLTPGAPLNLEGPTSFNGTLSAGVTIDYTFAAGNSYRVSVGNIVCGSYSAPGASEPTIGNSELTFSVKGGAAKNTFISAENGPSAAGSKVSKIEPAFSLYASAAVANVDQNKMYLQKDGSLLATPVYAGNFDSQAFVNFEGTGWTENGEYKLIVEAGAATIGGTACAAAEFVWTIGGSSSGCDAAKATDEVNLLSATNGGNAAGAAGITAMSRDFELTCDLAGLTRYNSEVGVKLMMPWDGGTYDITSSITNWNFDCDKITFSLNYDIDASYLSSAGNWKLTIYEESFLGASEDIYSAEASFTWTVAPAVVYNAPVLVGATNGGEAAGGKVSVLSEDFYITLSEPSRYAGYGVYYQYDGATDWDASLAITMSDDKTVAKVSVTGADLTREGIHTIYITYGAFVNAFDETKVLTAGGSFSWTVGSYTIRDVRNGSVVGYAANTTDEVDRPFFQNQFTVSLSAASVAANPFVATLKKNGAAYLSNAKVTATSGMEFVIEFQDWPHTTSSLPIMEGTTITGYTEVTTYNSLEPADYTLTIAAGDFTSGADQTEEWNGTWHVANVVYAWSLDVKGSVNGNNTTTDQQKPELAPNFTIAFQKGLSNARVGEEKISLLFQPESGAETDTLFAEPTKIECSDVCVTVTFGTEKLTGNGRYTVNVPKNAILASYVPDGGSMPVESGNASGSFTWTVENNYSFTMPESGWATYTVDYKSQWPSGCTVYYVADMKEGKVLLKQARYHAGESDERNAYMPAYTPLVVKGKAGEKYTVYRPIDEAYMTNFADNLLEGTVAGAAASESYVLDGAQFVKKNEAHAAHSAWLPTDGLASETLSFCFTEEEFNPTTGCEQVKLLNDVKKTMINGTLVIIRDGKMYNALGTRL